MTAYPPQDRLIRKEVALGTIREIEPPLTHIGLQLFPWMEVASDDVIFDYAKGLTDGLAPARAEDAESELAQKDLLFGGTGRASVIDWALKDHYSASDVTRYRENVMVQARLGGELNLPLTVGSMVSDFQAKIAREDALRRRKLDNRIEWMVMTAMSAGVLSYNDGKIIFSVDYNRPSNQQAQAPTGALFSAGTTHDPIGEFLAVQEFMYDTHGVRITRALTSRKVIQSFMNSDRFIARSGLVNTSGSDPVDLNYLMDGWGPQAALQVVERATGIQFIEYDSVYRTRPVGSTTITNNQFFPQNRILFLPDPNDVAEIGNELGLGRVLTSPHPEGNWQPGFYEWEQETKDPWGLNRGTGVKAFPVFPHMDLTFTMDVLA
jgi:hypothetical protein